MPLFIRLIKKMQASSLRLSWTFLLIVVLLHMVLGFALMHLASESLTESLSTWTYFYVVSLSTVGYGDLSPETVAGRWIASVYLIPGGIALFAALIGKASVTVSHYWRLQMQGNADYSHLKGHTLVIGWHGDTTHKIINTLKQDAHLPDEIVLCVVKDMSNPMPGEVKFVKGESFSDEQLLVRAGIGGASRVVIYDESDERVATIALSAYSLKSPDGHMVAHCDNPSTANMLRRTLPGIECTEALALEMLVRSATDAGISRVVNELLAVNKGATQFQTTLHNVPDQSTYGDMFNVAKANYNVTLLGVSNKSGDSSMLNPPADQVLQDGDLLFYMANHRLTQDQVAELLARSVPNH